MSGGTGTRQNCPDFHFPCPPTSADGPVMVENISLMNAVIRGHISILEVQFLKVSEIVKWNGGHKIFIFCSFLCLGSQQSATTPDQLRLWSPAEWFKYSINEFNQYSNNEMTHQSLFKNIHEHTWALSSYFNQKWHFNKGSKIWTSNGSKKGLFRIKTGLLSESLNYAEFLWIHNFCRLRVRPSVSLFD